MLLNLNLNNINLRVIPDTPVLTATHKDADFGGNAKMGVNGNLRDTAETDKRNPGHRPV